MYYESNSARIDEKIQHGKFVEELAAENANMEKKYGTLLSDVKKFAQATKKSMVEKTIKTMMSGKEDEMEELRKQVDEMKKVQSTQAEVIRAMREERETERLALIAERDALKEGKKKVEYAIFDLLKLSDANKDKLKRIRAVCDE